MPPDLLVGQCQADRGFAIRSLDPAQVDAGRQPSARIVAAVPSGEVGSAGQIPGCHGTDELAQRVVDVYLSFDTELKKIVAPLGRSTSLPIGMSDALGIDDVAAAERLQIKYVV